MADGHNKEIDFNFLSEEASQNYFADLNIELLKGAHIQKDSYYLYSLLQEKEGELRSYYNSLYGLELVRDRYNNETFFYLDFLDGKGKLSRQDRHRELSALNIITGILLVKMYYDKYFELQKIVTWEDLEHHIMESEYSDGLKKIFFEEVREFYSDTEWESVRKRILKCIREFETVGWVTKIPSNEHEIHFQLKESISRFAKLYEKELLHFDEFVTSYLKQLR